jgi:ribonuclease E
MTVDIVADTTLIIPEYIINVQNKSKKTIELVEHFEKLKNIELQIKEDNIIEKKESKKFHKKPFKKKPFFKKKFIKKTVTI